MQEAPWGRPAFCKYFVVGRLNLRHRGSVDGSILKRRAPIRPPLEDCQAADLVSNI